MVIVYIVSGIIYICIGVFGALGILGNCIAGENASTITDCFESTDIANLIVIIVYLFNIVTSFPIYFSIMKGSFFNLFMFGKIPTPK